MVSYEMQTFTGLFFKYKENIDKNTCKIYKKLIKFRYKIEREVQSHYEIVDYLSYLP